MSSLFSRNSTLTAQTNSSIRGLGSKAVVVGEDHEAIWGTTRVRKGLEPTNSNADVSERIFGKRNKKSVIGQAKSIIKEFWRNWKQYQAAFIQQLLSTNYRHEHPYKI